MGNSKSNLENSEAINVNHPYFGDIHLVTHEEIKYMKIRMLVDSQKTIKEWENSQQILKGIDPQSLLLPVDHKFEEQGMCGTTGVLHILYECHPVILKDEIQNRRQTSQFFEESEIWYLLHVLVASAADFHKRNHKVGDIRPGNIFINEQGQVKLANICSWPREEKNYFKSFNDKEQTYLAPEEMNQLQNDISSPNSDPVKGESFSIGLTLLDSICLEDCSKLYNFKNSTFDKNRLFALLAKLQSERYSDFLKQIVNELLIIDPNIRRSPEQIYQKILPYEYNIKNLLPFSPILTTPYNSGARSIVSTANNNYRESQYSTYKLNPQINPHGFTQSVYETRNTLTTPAPTIGNFPSIGYVSNPRITAPSQTYLNKLPYDTKVEFKSSDNYGSGTILSGTEGSKSKQQLLEQIDRQLEMSKKLFK